MDNAMFLFHRINSETWRSSCCQFIYKLLCIFFSFLVYDSWVFDHCKQKMGAQHGKKVVKTPGMVPLKQHCKSKVEVIHSTHNSLKKGFVCIKCLKAEDVTEAGLTPQKTGKHTFYSLVILSIFWGKWNNFQISRPSYLQLGFIFEVTFFTHVSDGHPWWFLSAF